MTGTGVDAILVENHGDAPFAPARVDAATVAAMTVAVHEVRRAVPLPLGVNVLKSDALSALAVAAATGATFVRVNVHVGAVVGSKAAEKLYPALINWMKERTCS